MQTPARTGKESVLRTCGIIEPTPPTRAQCKTFQNPQKKKHFRQASLLSFVGERMISRPQFLILQVEMGDGAAGTRRVLADVSNQLGKRRFVSISGNSATSSNYGGRTNMENELRKSNLPWCISGKESENPFKGKYEFEFGSRGDCDYPLVKPKKPCGIENFGVGAKPGQENAALGTLKNPGGTLKVSGLFDRNVPFPPRDVLKHGVLKKSDGFTKNLTSSVPGQCNKPQNSLSIAIGQEHHAKGTSSVGNPIGNDTVNKDLTNVSGNKGDGENVADLTSKPASTESPIPTDSSGPQESESVRCTAFTGDGSMDTSAGVDFLNSCSCSFCCKAAYIWSDLQYQDIKGQIAALKKSRKEVRSIVDRRYSHGVAHKNVQGNMDKSVKLQFDLMGQWRSLFLHSEDILVRENNKLQSSLVSLKELRDNCKDDLEALNALSSKK